jgi:hypothetical protein
MENLLVRLMIAAALLQLGMSWTDFTRCHSRACVQMVEEKSRDVLRIEWKPISVCPEEAKRFE